MSKLLSLETPPVTKLTTTFSLAELQAVRSWNAPEVTRAAHSDKAKSTSSAPSSARVATDYAVDRAEPCFITKVAAYTHEQAHIINAIRGQSEAHRMYKRNVEYFLERQGIINGVFDLDHVSNLANLDASLHNATDKYAMFAVTCSHEFLDLYIKHITSENEKWAALHSEGKVYTREPNLSDPSYRVPSYELVVLQPYHFLPDHSWLLFYNRAQGGAVEGVTSCKIVNRVLRQTPFDDTSPTFPSFSSFPTLRESLQQMINPYLVILAAEIKFRRYNTAGGPDLPSVYDSLMRKTIEVADLLYFQPSGPSGPATNQFIRMDETSYNVPVNWGATATEMGVRTGAEGESGGGTRRADADYWRNMLSCRDLELNDNDLGLLREIGESNRAASSRGQSIEQVATWRASVEV